MQSGKKTAAVVLTAALCVLGALYACITFEITLQTTGEGTLYAEKQRVHLCESVKIRIVPSDAPTPSVLKSITVHGEDCTILCAGGWFARAAAGECRAFWRSAFQMAATRPIVFSRFAVCAASADSVACFTANCKHLRLSSAYLGMLCSLYVCKQCRRFITALLRNDKSQQAV